MSYDAAMRALGIDDRIIACATGKQQLPMVSYESPADWYGSPPALIPIASNGSGPDLLGCWQPWKSTPGYVRLGVEVRDEPEQVAGSAEEFFTYCMLLALTESDGDLDDDGLEFAEFCGLTNRLPELDELSLLHGDEPEGLFTPWDWRSVPPAEFPQALAAGDFNTAWSALNTSGWEVSDAREAAARLAQAAGDPVVSTLVEAWLAVATTGNY